MVIQVESLIARKGMLLRDDLDQVLVLTRRFEWEAAFCSCDKDRKASGLVLQALCVQ